MKEGRKKREKIIYVRHTIIYCGMRTKDKKKEKTVYQPWLAVVFWCWRVICWQKSTADKKVWIFLLISTQTHTSTKFLLQIFCSMFITAKLALMFVNYDMWEKFSIRFWTSEKLLLQNPEKIIDRDSEVVKVLWESKHANQEKELFSYVQTEKKNDNNQPNKQQTTNNKQNKMKWNEIKWF